MPDEGGPGDEMAKMDPKINQYGSFDFEEQLPKPANPFEKTASQHVRDRRHFSLLVEFFIGKCPIEN